MDIREGSTVDYESRECRLDRQMKRLHQIENSRCACIEGWEAKVITMHNITTSSKLHR